MKQISPALLGLVLLLTPKGATAQQYDDFDYATTNGNAVIITGYTGNGGAVAIPSTINGLPVTTVWLGGLQNDANITSLAIPSSVTQIAGLHNCEGLFAITVDPANQVYSSLDGVLFNNAQTHILLFPPARAGSYTIPDGVLYVAVAAFSYSTGLVSVVIPSSVSSIDLEAFAACFELTNVFFLGNATPADSFGSVFAEDHSATLYYLPGTAGWNTNYEPSLGYYLPYGTWLPPVLWNPAASSPALRNGQFSFDITGTPNIPIAVEASTNLANGAWVRLWTGLLAGGQLSFSDPSWTNSAARFYRVHWP